MTFGGVSDIGVMAIAAFTRDVAAPLDGYQPAPASFPALPPGPGPLPGWERDLLDEEARQMALPVLAPVPVTERAVIGDELRLPQMWCEAAPCISWHRDPQAAGERDARDRAIAAGWRHDAFGRLVCADCQQRDPAFRATRPVAWHHPEVRRRWQWDDPEVRAWWECGGGVPVGDPREEDTFRLGVEAEVGRRVSYEDPALAGAIAGATARTAGAS
jgi:hypothetical protein